MRRILVGYSCNNSCVFCAQGSLREGPPADPKGVIERDVRPGDVVALVGGEPTLSADLPGLVRLAREKGAASVIVQTNGRRLAYAPYTLSLREAGASALDVSLHGSTAPMHESHTRAAGSFAQTITGIGVAIAAGLRVGVTIVLTRSNYRHAGEIVRLVHARGVRRAHLSTVTMAGAARTSRSLLFSDDLAKAHLAEAARLARALRVELCDHPDDDRTSPIFAGLGFVEPAESRAASAVAPVERESERDSLPSATPARPPRHEVTPS